MVHTTLASMLAPPAPPRMTGEKKAGAMPAEKQGALWALPMESFAAKALD
ncbi:MAG: hypothetical protein JSR14_18750 [Proteobacteria bacterium]|nr:hypothetical protein [Pseudomonadota bacterium]